jgi:hypothetical protein
MKKKINEIHNDRVINLCNWVAKWDEKAVCDEDIAEICRKNTESI